ncbi:MAG: endolytic transglycosylase MltG [Burkholderia sp.]|nr:endolytic transglycosylase MltG [Burkholderia sp.]
MLKKFYVFAILIITSATSSIFYWSIEPLSLCADMIEVTIKPNSSARSIILQLKHGGIPIELFNFIVMTRILNLSTHLKSGSYEFRNGITPYNILKKLVRGDVKKETTIVIEGWTFKRMRLELDTNPNLVHLTTRMTDAELLRTINASNDIIQRGNGEGLFFPDTYFFDKGTSDISIYQKAYRLMENHLNEVWIERQKALPYCTPYDVLTAASIVEKETSYEVDRPLVAAVFANRLKIGMPLQSDPSVIYGLGSSYNGHLHKRDLQTNVPYNTYIHRGLPPTPISLPSRAALRAVTCPAHTDALYFIAKGDRTSVFSNTLEEHNKAIERYIRTHK